jgi:glycosyltransferase involved in cell wall biosynthesis
MLAMVMGIVMALLLVGWLAQLWLAHRVIRAVPPLSSLSAPAPERWPKLSIIVPARDEAKGIEAALRSKLSCGYPSLEVVAIDDRSRDETGAIIDRLAASDPRISAAHVQTLPDGWLGKLNAMSEGLKHASGDWVLFSDADVHVEPGTLERLIAAAERDQVDIVSVFPRMHGVAPAVDAVVCGLLRVLSLTGRVWAANDDRSKIAAGVGAFNLVRKRVLESTHAIERLRMEVADDMGLALLLKHEGGRSRFFTGGRDVHMVFMHNLGEVRRSAFKGGHMLGFSWWKPLAFALLPITVEVALPAFALACGGLAAALAAAVFGAATLTHVRLAHHFDAPVRGALLWPLGIVINAAMTAAAGLTAWRKQGVVWRHTFYSRSVLEQGRVIAIPSLRVRA